MAFLMNSLTFGLIRQMSGIIHELSEKLKYISPEHKESEEDKKGEFVCPFLEMAEDVFKMSEEERHKLLMEKLSSREHSKPKIIDFDCSCD